MLMFWEAGLDAYNLEIRKTKLSLEWRHKDKYNKNLVHLSGCA